MANENSLLLGGGPGGISHVVKVLELAEAPPLSNGVTVCSGRIAVSKAFTLARGTRHQLTLRNGRVAQIWILDTSQTEVTFCGTFT